MDISHPKIHLKWYYCNLHEEIEDFALFRSFQAKIDVNRRHIESDINKSTFYNTKKLNIINISNNGNHLRWYYDNLHEKIEDFALIR